MTTPAGWYDDGSGRQRWWDGVAWTEHTVAAPAPATAEQPDSAQQGSAQQGSAQHGSVPQTASPQQQHVTPQDAATEGIAAPAIDASGQSTAGVVPVAGSPTAPAIESATFEPPYVLQTATSAGDMHPGPAAGPPVWDQAPMYGQQGTAYPAQGTAYPAQGLGAPFGAPTPPQAKPKLSVLGIIGLGVAVIGLVLSCFPSIALAGWVLLGVGFVVSLVSVFLRGTKWPGIVGIAVSVLGSIVAIAVMLLSLSVAAPGATVPTSSPGSSSSDGGEPDESAAEGAERVYINDLEVGHCLPLVEWEDEVYDLPVVPCDQPHTDEVYFIFDAPDGDFPGDAELQTLATERCDAAFEEFIGIPYADSELDNYWFVPTETSWKRANDRAIQCIVFSYEDLTGTLEGAAR
ncbi:DUF2510 domain-containing protein [Microbacterium sp. Leaf159]|uniref:DUF2510 domain-containing protein n=1 Tax=Microbacterium sp. Leaf159 TaxID=1736279 RepID=UPI0006F4F11E|nr:DUF2510 domain-containing protein [Microbacterium sp. Leaf159]KQR36903.1 hypothetical protein ASF80_13815 [Microbacterium sp. Leaf159]